MRDRAIDLALIVGLALVAGAIVWTLFSLGGSTSGRAPDAPPGTTSSASSDRIDPGGGSGIVPVDPSGGAIEIPDADADEAAPTTDPDADAPPVPETGIVALGRIGFSYVTGGAGACGIVLEPWLHVAVSRELLDAYGCGAEVTLTLDDVTDGRTTVTAVVADTMNESFSRTVNIYVGEDEPALQYGLTSGTIRPR